MALQGAVRDVHDQVADREAPAGRVGGDGGGGDLVQGPGRPRPVADGLRALLVTPEVTRTPSPRGRRTVQRVRRSVLVGGQASEKLPR